MNIQEHDHDRPLAERTTLKPDAQDTPRPQNTDIKTLLWVKEEASPVSRGFHMARGCWQATSGPAEVCNDCDC
jgi:hypothetical protein